MNETDQIALMISLLAKNFDTHMNIIWATIALLLAAIGWVITSLEARRYLAGSWLNKVVSLIVLTTMLLMHYYLLWITQQQSAALYEGLTELVTKAVITPENDGCDLIYHSDLIDHIGLIYHISETMFFTRGSVTLILFLFLGFLVIQGEKK